MTDVFISYSRKDKAFVERLHRSLVAHQRDVWVDWEDIPLTADWWKEICAGIEAADTFICILSPDFTASEVCNQEVEHALANKKRFVPVLHRELDTDHGARPAHPAISSHNWIFIRPEDDYDTAIESLFSALETDLDHVRAHTRLLVRAREWESKDHNVNLLLRGSELRASELWLPTALQKQPEPAPIQIAYITESRRAENRRQRLLLAGVSAALLVSISLALLSFFLFQQAEDNRKTAEDNGATSDANAIIAENERATAVALQATAEYSSDVAVAAALAARSQLELERAPEFAVLLALDALENSVYTAQAEAALGMAVQNTRQRLLVQPRDRLLYISNDWAPDGSRFAGSDRFGNVYVWDAETGETVHEWSEDALVRVLRWSPNGTQIATMTDDGTVIVRDTETTDELLRFEQDSTLVLALDWSLDSTHLLTGSYGEDIIIWDTQTGEQVARGPGQIAAWSPDGGLIASTNYADNSTTLSFWDPMTGEIDHTIEAAHLMGIHALDWSPDSTALVTANTDSTAYIWDLTTGSEIMALTGHRDSLRHVDWSSGGRYIITGSDTESGFDVSVRIWDSFNGEQVAILPGVQRVPRWSPDGSRLLTIDEDFGISAWSSTVGTEQLTFRGHADAYRGINDVDWSPDSRWVVTAGSDNAAKVWDPRIGALSLVLPHQNSVSSANWSPDGRWIVTASYDNTVRIWDAETGTEQVVLDAFADWVEYAAWSPDGTRIITASRTNPSLNMWQVNPEAGTAENRNLFAPYEDGITFSHYFMMVAWSPDGTQIVASGDKGAFVYDANSGEELYVLPQGGRGIAWSDDGRYILQTAFQPYDSPDTGDNNAILIWDTTMPNAPVRSLSGHTNLVWRADWSPDGTRILSAAEDNTAKVWDAATGHELLTLRGHDAFVWDAAWSPDGTMIVTVSGDGLAKVWPAWETPQALIDYAYACCVSRGFTPQETGQLNALRHPTGG